MKPEMFKFKVAVKGGYTNCLVFADSKEIALAEAKRRNPNTWVGTL